VRGCARSRPAQRCSTGPACSARGRSATGARRSIIASPGSSRAASSRTSAASRDRDAGAFCGLWFADSDIHKVLEAIGWETGRAGDGGWREFVDETVALMRDAQDEDGYLNYTQTGERMARVAAGGVRLVVDELRTDVTTTRKDGSRGRLRMDYGDHRDPQVAIAWSWKFVVCRVAGYAESAVRDGGLACSAWVMESSGSA
jgi:hypothetical protein